MGLPPIVTGVSPKEGPPGTRVTIRGENFGSGPDDIIGLIICNSDCLLSAEWISSNKIVARSGPGKSKGDIVVITKSGGKGSCTVQFRGYHETIGPLKESAVWVDESHLTGLGRHRALIPSTFQQDDPLGLSVENAVKKYPEEELQELFPESNGELGSEHFSPSWFLLQHHHSTGFDDLKAGLSFLKRRVEAQKEGQISFLKTHAGSVIEQMDTLLTLKKVVEENKTKYGPDMTASLENSILSAKIEAGRLFDDVLKRKEQADGTRNALGILQRFRFLFHLPSTLDKNIQKADYDLVINDYARAKALFRNTEVQVFKRVLLEAEQRILNLREVLQEKLQQYPTSLEEQKKIIRNLTNLECPNDPAWLCIAGQYKHCSQILFQCKDKYLGLEQEEIGKSGPSKGKRSNNLLLPSSSSAEPPPNSTPGRVTFIEELNDRFMSVFPELWRLGQAYFAGELFVRTDALKKDEFKKMVLDVVTIFSQLIRAALVPHTLDRQSPHRAQFGIWQPFSGIFSDHEGIGSWFVLCLRTVRTCYAELLTLDLPTEAIDVIRDLLHDLRVHCMRSLLMQAAENVTHLASQENWKLEFIESHGSITQLPHVFETQVIECLQLVKETVFQSEQRETNLMENASVLSDLNLLVQKLLFSFARSTERLASSDQNHTEDLTREMKLLLGLSNCQYTMLHILPRLKEHWNKLGYPDLSAAIQAAKELLAKTEQRLMEAYLEEKVEPLIGIVEPSMYAGRFDWNKNLPITNDIRPYCKEIIMNMIAVHAEVAQVSPSLVSRILERVVREVAAELGRLFSCVNKFSESGALQASADVAALSRACLRVRKHSNEMRSEPVNPFSEAADMIPPLTTEDSIESHNRILMNFEKRMKFQLFCLDLK
ncbi:exocyst complex component 2 [Daphnia magna]|uniref:Exocyst complex component 2 n=1 Tax=Daphnia magna TaxID=35525 RepID=A0ABQ9YPX0_9CRUS|nr:exocyst complex component 2 [Daphnia magna]XP_032777232.1 exocyst complex component 2 [Daphnia magna]XP_045028180.1 exocyst complex component 2 [Daphnia magna]XP_045028183.1 exocyst complex component 2 [Daphnia magna]KAK4002670.1 hypothetical protein OUZ56_004482 [Daphnia magna]